MPDAPILRILLAEDDEDDYILTKEALGESQQANVLHRVRDGEELLEYLRSSVAPNGPGSRETDDGRIRPSLILLDLNMPRKDGREALAEIKGDPQLRRIPVVILTTSDAEEDINQTYDLGVNSFIQKPVSFSDFIETVARLTEYWCRVARLPS